MLRAQTSRPSLAEPMNRLMRAALLAAADNPTLQRFMYRYGMTLGARRFVAGESVNDFRAVARSLNERGFMVAATQLGEGVRNRSDAKNTVHEYQRLLECLSADSLRSTVALKLTQLGLSMDRELARDNLATIVEHANRLGDFIRIDMEQSSYVEATLSIYRELRAAGKFNVGTVLQAYLYRSEADLRLLLPLEPNLRLVKGAYLEPPEIAFQRKSDVDRNYVRLIELSLRNGGFTAIATHDHAIIEWAIAFMKQHDIPHQRFEFQMLYGVRPTLQAELLGRGYKVRLAVPFGSQWYPYLMRRLAERPANLFFFMSTVWRK